MSNAFEIREEYSNRLINHQDGLKVVSAPSPRSHLELRESDDGDLLASQEDSTARLAPPRQAPHWTSAAEALLRKLGGRSAGGDWFELDSWGNGFLQLESGGTVVLGVQAGSTAPPSDMASAPCQRNARGTTMTRPISLGEVLASRPLRKSGIALPAAAGFASSLSARGWPAIASHNRTVLSAAEGERFIMMHGDNYGCVETQDAEGTWQSIETVAEYMPAGTDRRYLRRIGEAYGEFQRRSGSVWESECPAGIRRQRLYLIDSRFEVLNDAEYERRHGPTNDGPAASLA